MMRSFIHLLSALCLLATTKPACAQSLDSLRLHVFAPSDLASDASQNVAFSQQYTPSGSTWLLDFDESSVFQAEMNIAAPGSEFNSYQIRIGKGGNLYSLRGAFGESVPPQFRPDPWVQETYGGGASYAPWVDEVWQMVAVDGQLNNSPDSSYFIHQAGVYLKTPNQTEPFFSPMLAEHFDEESQSYSCVNWGQQAHTEDLESAGFTSSLLYYSKYSVVGDGVLQVDQMMYNFGDDNISFINVPWGGVRHSNLGETFISNPDHSYEHVDGLYGATPVIQASNTAGWVGWSNDLNGGSPSLAVANAISTVSNGNVIRYGDAGNLDAAWNQRDYSVLEMIRFPNGNQLSFGTAMQFRYFYVLDSTLSAVAAKIDSLNLPSLAFDNDMLPNLTDVDHSSFVLTPESNGALTVSSSDPEAGWLLALRPFEGSHPVFQITSADGAQRITSDPYAFSSKPWDGAATDWNLLGFAPQEVQGMAWRDTICSGEPYTSPAGNDLVLTSDTILIDVLSTATGADSVVFSHITTLNSFPSYLDVDGDGFGDEQSFIQACETPEGYSSVGGDCFDGDATVYPNAPGTQHGIDNNCDGLLNGDEPTLCYGDVEIDGDINVNDILSLLSNVGCNGFCGSQDLDFDGNVGVNDMLVVLAAFGTNCN
ncbi:MAG: putative metal-binding motif-containing protein [Flavobacteriales bacterium]